MKRYIATCNYDIGDGLVKKDSAVEFCEESLRKGFIRATDEPPAPVNPNDPVLQTRDHISPDQEVDEGEDTESPMPPSEKPTDEPPAPVKSGGKPKGQGKKSGKAKDVEG
jgi:hypothetical protein